MSQNPETRLDKKQFELLFKSHFQYLVNYATQYVQDSNTAEDIVQKVFITLWEKRATINPQQSVKSYLFTAVRNNCLNYIRDNKKYRSRVLDLDCGEFDIIEPETESQEALQKQIEHALSELPEKCRKVFELSRIHKLKYKEIAEELDVSVKTVEAHMSKALKTLRVLLKNTPAKIILTLCCIKIFDWGVRVFNHLSVF